MKRSIEERTVRRMALRSSVEMSERANSWKTSRSSRGPRIATLLAIGEMWGNGICKRM